MSSISYNLSQIRCFLFDVDGVLSRSVTTLSSEGRPMRTGNVKDGYALQLAVKRGFIVGVISGGNNPETGLRMKDLGVVDYYHCCSDKVAAMQEIAAKYTLLPNEILYVGDDLPDMPLLRAVGLAVAPSDAAADVLEEADYVSPYRGGEGVVRDVIEQTLRAQGLWATHGKGLYWD